MPEIFIKNNEFVAMASHDLKNPIIAQIRAANLLYSGVYGELSGEAKNLVLNIIASNKYMQALLDSILCGCKFNNSGLILNKTKNDFRKTLENALCNIGILSETRGQTVEIKYSGTNFIKEYDEIEIQRVIINLLINAFKYSKENSKIEITVENKPYLKLLIKTVSGAKILETEIYSKGFGLGLVICDKILTAHGGELIKAKEEENYFSGFVLP